MSNDLLTGERCPPVSNVESVLYLPPGIKAPFRIHRKLSGLIFDVNGSSAYEFDDPQQPTLTIVPNTILFLPKDSVYQVHPNNEEPLDCFVINLDFVGVPPEPALYSPSNHKAILQKFQSAKNVWNSKKCGYYEQTMSYVYDIMSLIKQGCSSSYVTSAKQKILEPALSYIRENSFQETISVGDLAAMCGISEVYFRRLFRETTMYSPKKYIEALRFEKAGEMIASGEYQVSYVAGMCGYYNDSYFCKCFKKHFGVPPSQYMETEKNN